MFEPDHAYPGDGRHTASYYAASANPAPARATLTERLDTDVCIVGAGFSGLSTALHLAERGREVVVLEGARVGWGASGRNGGQIVNGLNAGLDRIEQRYGQDTAAVVGSMLQTGGNIIRRLVETYSIDCDLKSGNLFTALTGKHLRELEARQKLWARHGMNDLVLLDKAGVREHIGSDTYTGALLDTSGGHLHPLNLTLGEAAAIESLGGKVYEHSPMTGYHDGAQILVNTAQGEIRCNQLVLCGNAYLGRAAPELINRIMPVSTQVMATEPLSAELAGELLPTDHCVEDIRYILDYYRLSADHRLLFGGGTVYGGTDPADIIAKLRPAMLKVFPQLHGISIDYAWSGNFALSFSRVPQMGRLADNVYFAHGYSGHGVTGTHLFGRILSEAISGETDTFDKFAAIPWFPFPGGRRFRAPYSTIGSWWYAIRDKFGV